MTNPRQCTRLLALAAGVLFAAACSDADVGMTGVDFAAGGSLDAAHTVALEDQVCQTADFDGIVDEIPVYEHGDFVDPLSIDFGGAIGTLTFDLSVALAGSSYVPNGTLAAKVWNTDANITHSDTDLLTPPQGFCAACEPFDKILILADDDFGSEGDIDLDGFGGTLQLTITRDDGMEFLIREVDIFDQEEIQFEGIRLLRDGSTDNIVIPYTASISDDGQVATDVQNSQPTTFGTSWVFEFKGSGAVDELLVCVEEPDEPMEPGGQGCTPGYWRQPHHFDEWTEYETDQLLTTVFTVPEDLELKKPEKDDPEDITLHDAVTLRGGGVNALLRHAVAALLNAANPDVAYDLTVQQVVDMVNAALASGDFDELKDELEAFNEQGCPLN